MRDNLQNGQPFSFEITDDLVSVFPSENLWRMQFYGNAQSAGGLPEAMARYPAMAALYSILADMEPAAASILIQSVGIKTLADKYVRLLTLYSSALDFTGGHLELPGGDATAPVWAELAGLPAKQNIQTNPQPFLIALLDKDEGRLLRFYFVLSQLDSARQRYFTASPKRTRSFYEAFRQSSQIAGRCPGIYLRSRSKIFSANCP